MKVIVLFVFVLGALSAAGEVFFANVGGKVTLNCGVSSYRNSLKWLHGYDLLHSVDQRGFPRKGSVDLARRSVVRQTNLEISSVRETDAGQFTCLADWTYHEHSLSVFSESYISHNPTSITRSVVRQTNLEISSVRETDAGQFTCSADWTPREHSLAVFSVSVSVTPSAVLKLCDEATLHCEVKHLLKGCEVKWKSPNADSPEWPSTVQLKSVTSSHNGTWECIITCDGKQLKPPTTTPPSTRKNITLFVTSVQKTTCTTCTANDCPLGLSCWMWIAMGVCCQFGMFLIVCVTVLCKCMSRRMVCEERRPSSIYV